MMSKLFAGLPLAAVVLLGALGGPVAAASGRGSCDAHAGATVLENGQVRVFRLHKTRYACARSNGSVHRLFTKGERAKGGAGPVLRFWEFELAGPYFAYQEEEGPGGTDAGWLNVIDVQTGRAREIGFSQRPEGAIQEYVLTAEGTAVLIQNLYQPPYDGKHGTSYVREIGPHSQSRDGRTLDHGSPGAIESLALSASGRVVYWTNGGAAKSSNIP